VAKFESKHLYAFLVGHYVLNDILKIHPPQVPRKATKAQNPRWLPLNLKSKLCMLCRTQTAAIKCKSVSFMRSEMLQIVYKTI
jgi:hypothetical protein